MGDFGSAIRIGIDHVSESEIRHRRVFTSVNCAEASDADHRCAQFIHDRKG
jgi:hypothetical protein